MKKYLNNFLKALAAYAIGTVIGLFFGGIIIGIIELSHVSTVVAAAVSALVFCAVIAGIVTIKEA